MRDQRDSRDVCEALVKKRGARYLPALAINERRWLDFFLHDRSGVAIDGDERITDRKQRGHDERQWPLGNVSPETACADSNDTYVGRRDFAALQVACDLLRFVQKALVVRNCA